MSRRGLIATLLLLVLAALQLAMLAVPAALILAGQPTASWPLLWQRLVDGPAPLAALVALASALILGAPAGIALWRRGWGLVTAMVLAPLLLPVALLGGSGDVDGQAILLAGHASLGLALGAGCCLLGLLPVDRRLLQAAASSGVSPAGAYRRVVLPLAMPGIAAGCLLTAAASLATSLVALALTMTQGRTASLASLPHLGASPLLSVLGVALLLCAATAAALALLRRP